MSKQFICFIATVSLIAAVAFQSTATQQHNSVDTAVQRRLGAATALITAPAESGECPTSTFFFAVERNERLENL